MMFRTSIVNQVRVRSVLLSSIVNVGDVRDIRPDTRVLAVQREKPIFFGNEGNVTNFNVFEQPFVKNQNPTPKEVSIQRRNENRFIHVHLIDILGISASSILQIGNAENVDCTSRIKHIRQFLIRQGEDASSAGGMEQDDLGNRS